MSKPAKAIKLNPSNEDVMLMLTRVLQKLEGVESRLGALETTDDDEQSYVVDEFPVTEASRSMSTPMSDSASVSDSYMTPDISVLTGDASTSDPIDYFSPTKNVDEADLAAISPPVGGVFYGKLKNRDGQWFPVFKGAKGGLKVRKKDRSTGVVTENYLNESAQKKIIRKPW